MKFNFKTAKPIILSFRVRSPVSSYKCAHFWNQLQQQFIRSTVWATKTSDSSKLTIDQASFLTWQYRKPVVANKRSRKQLKENEKKGGKERKLAQ